MTEKVFVIGLQRTGTTSVGAALELLGYHLGGGFRANHARGMPVTLPLSHQKLVDAAMSFALRADAFEDSPWPLVFREMDQTFAGSKFILTRRDLGSWIDSMKRHIGEEHTAMLGYTYGHARADGFETEYVCRHQRHIDDVLGYFAKRPDDLLVTNLTDLDWPTLCGFLNKREPDASFPHSVKSRDDGARVNLLPKMMRGILGR